MKERLAQLRAWMESREDEHLEFKEAKARFDFEELVKYCCALANERSGRIILGVTDKRPRRVVGTDAFRTLERTTAGLVERLHLRVEAEELAHPDGRVVLFHVPSRPVGMPVQYKGAYWMRGGDGLVPMTPDLLQRIFAEAQPDFSAQQCPGVRLEDLDPVAIDVFRRRWAEKSRRPELTDVPTGRLLEDAELLVSGAITYAGLILLGTRQALSRHLAQAEVIFEYRADEAAVEYQQRKEHREGFLLFHDDLWNMVNLRNTVFSYQEGLFRRDIAAFNEAAVREAILNAVSHRNYRLAGSTFVRQWPTKIEIVSPGGFPPEITPETILFRQSPRNRRIAEALARCGLVERSGQGADRMFQAALREGKLPPDFSRSDAYQVALILHGTVQDEAFVRFLERLGAETQRSLSVEDLVVLDAIRRGQRSPEALRDRLPELLAMGAIERIGRQRVMLANRFYVLKGRPGEYTRRRGLDRETKKALLLRHIQASGEDGAPFEEFTQVLPAAPRNELKVLLRELKVERQIHVRGKTRAARWYVGREAT
jgi:ATP-dependent DNA helicase RecG